MNVGLPSIRPTSMLASSVTPALISKEVVSDKGIELTAAPHNGSRRRNNSWLISEISSKISRTSAKLATRWLTSEKSS